MTQPTRHTPDAIPVASAGRIVGYRTIDAAIAGAASNPRQSRARADGALFVGRRFVDAWGDLRQWVLEFDGPLWLRVFVVGDERGDDTQMGLFVDWQVEAARPDVTPAIQPISLAWSTGRTSSTDSMVLSAARRNAEFRQFWVNEGCFYVYLRRKPILCFGAARRRDTRELLLYVHEDND